MMVGNVGRLLSFWDGNLSVPFTGAYVTLQGCMPAQGREVRHGEATMEPPSKEHCQDRHE